MSLAKIILLLNTYKYLVLFPIVAVEGPIVALAVGFLVHMGTLEVVPSFLILILGDIIPDSFYYFLGYWGSDTKFARKLISRSSFFSKHLDLTHKLWTDHGKATMFFSKLAYGLSIPFLISAGSVKMPFTKFLNYAIPVTIFQYGVLMLVGYSAGRLLLLTSVYVNFTYYSIAALLVLFIIAYVMVSKYAKRKVEDIENEEIISKT